MRFAAIEAIATAPFDCLEAIRVDDRIVFQTGTECARAHDVGCIAGLGGFSAILIWIALSELNSLLSWLLVASILACLSYVVRSNRRQEPNYSLTHFEIDTVGARIINHVTSDPDDKAVALERVKYFLAWSESSNSDSLDGYIYIVFQNGREVAMTRNLGGAVGSTQRNVQLLGFICDKPVFVRDKQKNIIPCSPLPPTSAGAHEETPLSRGELIKEGRAKRLRITLVLLGVIAAASSIWFVPTLLRLIQSLH